MNASTNVTSVPVPARVIFERLSAPMPLADYVDSAPLGKEAALATSIVIPCYNEAKRLDTACIRNFLLTTPAVNVVFVDDGSKDDTVAVLEGVCAGLENKASILRCGRNQGKAEAVRLGLQHALRTGNPKYVGFWDADLATPLDAIGRFTRILEERPEIDMVFGSRVKLLGRTVKRRRSRHYLGRIFATVVSNVLDLAIYDTQCGAKIFRVDSGIGDVVETRFLSKWIFDVELIARYRKLYQNTLRNLEEAIYEYPLESWEDVKGSKVKSLDFLAACSDLVRIRAEYL